MKKKIKLFDPIIDNKELLALENPLKSKLWASGAGGKHYRSTSEREKFNKSAASVLYTHNDTGFIWLDISRVKLIIRFHDSSGKKIYEYTKKR